MSSHSRTPHIVCKFFYSFLLYYILFRILHKTSGSVVAERSRALNSNSGVSVQQSVGLSPSRDICVLKQDILPLLRPFGWDVKPLVRSVVQHT